MKQNGQTGTHTDAQTAQSQLTTTPLPGSHKIYVEGTQPGVRVPFREIPLTPSPVHNGNGRNGAPASDPVVVYDTSGPYTDPKVTIDIRHGLAPIRLEWIRSREDTEELATVSSAYGRQRAADPKLQELRFQHIRCPRRALASRNVSQMHYARKGIVTPEMEFIAIRENQAQELAQREAEKKGHGYARLMQQHSGNSWGASIPPVITPEFVRDEVAR